MYNHKFEPHYINNAMCDKCGRGWKEHEQDESAIIENAYKEITTLKDRIIELEKHESQVIKELRQQLKECENGYPQWLPLELAPKNDNKILLFHEGAFFIGYWDKEASQWRDIHNSCTFCGVEYWITIPATDGDWIETKYMLPRGRGYYTVICGNEIYDAYFDGESFSPSPNDILEYKDVAYWKDWKDVYEP